MNKILILLLVAFLVGCSIIPEQYAAAPNRSLVQGVSSGNTEVKIRTVDGGDVIWVRGYNLGDKVWLEPGLHQISVMCSTTAGGVTYGSPVAVEVDVQPGFTYYLEAEPSADISAKPRVHVRKMERK